ncbi:hypothetical protein V6N13_048509 [Hibiscus sabdariffa]|uniref:Uncharacterized protein n=1 Tax=Hibiscus sabdariffa TaxID=183260 RepID=A0ABR2F7F4_9ROSI
MLKGHPFPAYMQKLGMVLLSGYHLLSTILCTVVETFTSFFAPLKSRAIATLARHSSFRSSSMMTSVDVQSVLTDITLNVIIMGTSSSLVSSGPDGYPSAGLELCHQ